MTTITERAVPLGGRTRATIEVRRGLQDTTIRADAAPGELLHVHGDRRVPAVEIDGDVVRLIYPRVARDRLDRAKAVALNSAVDWDITVAGAVSHVVADLTGARLRSFIVDGGVADVDLDLPRPAGTVPVRLGSVSRVTIRRPAGVPVRVTITRGARALTVDRQHLGATGGRTTIASPDFAAATHKLDIRVRGASRFTVTTW